LRADAIIRVPNLRLTWSLMVVLIKQVYQLLAVSFLIGFRRKEARTCSPFLSENKFRKVQNLLSLWLAVNKNQ
jgi:hypothetical protein